MHFVPRKAFFVTGLGVHKHRLASFEAALRDAGIAPFNLVYVSSILPPNCQIVEREEGLADLDFGQIVYCVMAKSETCEPSRLIATAIGLAVPQESNRYGYISEHHAFGESADFAGEYAEDLAATMLATTLGIDFDPDVAWNERKQIYEASGQIIKTTAHSVDAEGPEDGSWITAISAAVFVI
jgi:arginine decarboxylase